MARTSLAEFVQKRRWDLKLSQQALADRMGKPVSDGYIAQLEMGNIKRPKSERLSLLARALEVTEADLLRAMGMLPEAEQRAEDDKKLLLKAEVGRYIDGLPEELSDDDVERFRQSVLRNVQEMDAELRGKRKRRGSSAP